jgi:peptidoglycan pentaglycine glycine transferase (the first glycine)
MQKVLYKKENNLFQSSEWADFQKSYGHSLVEFGDFRGINLSLTLGKSFTWIQKGPKSISNLKFKILDLPKGTVFIRLEPESISDIEIKKKYLKKVGQNSLLSGQKSPAKTTILMISKTEDELLAQMKSKTRYNIRLAEKKGVTVTITNTADDLCELLQKTAQRQSDYSLHPAKYYEQMLEKMATKGLVKVFVAKDENGEAIAAIMVSFYGEVATYLHGGFSDKHRSLMAPYLCQWEAIKYAKNHGCKYYDFWGVAETDDPKDPWAGISRFKRSFGTVDVEFSGAYDLIINHFWYNIFLIAAKLRHLASKNN